MQDGILRRASKRLVDEEALLPELGPVRLNNELQKYIWKDKDHLFLKDLWGYLNRFTYLPRLKDRSVLTRSVTSAISELMPGPFAYAESWDDSNGAYRGLVINKATRVQVVIDGESLIVAPKVAEANRPEPPIVDPVDPVPPDPLITKPTRFMGTVMISPDRPARDVQKVIEGVVQQLTTLPGSEVTIKLEIDADVPDGLDQGKVRTLVENANTLGFIEKEIK